MYVLTNPPTLTGTNQFTAPVTAKLEKNTKYFVVFEETRDEGRFWLRVTDSDTLDSVAAGWSLDTNMHFKEDDGAWQQQAFNPSVPLLEAIAIPGDVVAPTVVDGGVAISSTPDGVPASLGPAYAVGDTLEIAVEFDQQVLVRAGADVGFRFTMDGAERTAAYVRGSRSRVLRFEYDFTTSDPAVSPADGIGIGSATTTWTGAEGNIRNIFGNLDANLDHPALGLQAGHGFSPAVRPAVVDGGIAITSMPRGIVAAGGSQYVIGDTLEIAVTFNPTVKVASGADPGFRFTMAGEERTAAYAGGSGSKVLRFEYTFADGDPEVNDDGIGIGDSSATWTGADGNITNPAGTAKAILRHPAPGLQAGHGFEPNERPTFASMRFVSSPRGPEGYGVGETIEVAVDFESEKNDAVFVEGDVQAALEVGANTRTMHFLRGDLTGGFTADAIQMDGFVLGYVVQAADVDADGVTFPANAFAKDGDPREGALGGFEISDVSTLIDLATDAVAAGAGHAVDGSYSADRDARLDRLAVAGRTLVPAFDRDVTAYTVDAGDRGTVRINAAPIIGQATVVIFPGDAQSGTEGHQVALGSGSNRVEARVTSADGRRTRTYTIDIMRTGRALVSNHAQTFRESRGARSAQPFTTGNEAGGYVVRAVQVRLAGTAPAPGDALVRIFTDDSGPDESIATLSAPATLTANALNTFTAPAGTWLERNTTYHVVTSNAADTGGIPVGVTDSDAEDTGNAAGWSIGDTRYIKSSSDTVWKTQPVSVMIGIEGTVGVRLLSDNARLADLTLAAAPGGAAVDLAPAPFDPATRAYTAVVGNGIDQVTLRAAPEDPHARVSITHDNDPATPEEATLALAEGSNRLTVRVTSEDGSETGTWRVDVVRQAPAAPCPTPNHWCATMTTGYTLADAGALRTEEYGHRAGLGALAPAGFSFNAGSWWVTEVLRTVRTHTPSGAVLSDVLTLDAAANLPAGTVVTVGGAELAIGPGAATPKVGRYRWDLAAPGAPAAPARWAVGSAVAVSARIAVASGDATLSALSLEDRLGAAIALDPAPFDPDTDAYSVSVHHFVDRVTLRVVKSAPTAQVAIAADDDPATPLEAGRRLAAGANTFTVTVADRGVTRTYTVTVTRAREPAPLPVSSLETLWSASLTVSDLLQLLPHLAPKGCASSEDVAARRCSEALTDDDFTLYDTAFAVEEVVLFGGSLAGDFRVKLDATLTAHVPAPASDAMLLDVGGTLLSLDDPSPEPRTLTSRDTGLDWTAGEVVDLRLLGRSDNTRIDPPELTDDDGARYATGPAAGGGDRFAALLAGPTARVGLEVEAESPHATVAIAGDPDPTTPGEATLDAGAGLNEYEVTVSAQDGFSSRTHTVLVRWLEVLGVEVVSSPDAGPGDDAPGTYGVGERILVEVGWSEDGTVAELLHRDRAPRLRAPIPHRPSTRAIRAVEPILHQTAKVARHGRSDWIRPRRPITEFLIRPNDPLAQQLA